MDPSSRFPTGYPPSGSRATTLQSTLPAATPSTMLMVRGLPQSCTCQMFLRALNKSFERAFDFLYVPKKFKGKGNRGFAIVNFHKESRALDFTEALQGTKVGVYINAVTEIEEPGDEDGTFEVEKADIKRVEKSIEQVQAQSPATNDNEGLSEWAAWQPLLFNSEGKPAVFPMLSRALSQMAPEAATSAGGCGGKGGKPMQKHGTHQMQAMQQMQAMHMQAMQQMQHMHAVSASYQMQAMWQQQQMAAMAMQQEAMLQARQTGDWSPYGHGEQSFEDADEWDSAEQSQASPWGTGWGEYGHAYGGAAWGGRGWPHVQVDQEEEEEDDDEEEEGEVQQKPW